VRGNGLVVEIHVRVDSGNPSLVPNKQTTGQPPEALVAAPLTMPAGKTSLCVRATEGLGLSGIPCQAGLQNMQVEAGDWSLGLTGKAKGSTRQAVVTLYYLAENL
jgi:hypothetical protein